MTVQHYADQPQQRRPEEDRQAKATEAGHHEAHAKEAGSRTEQASRSVMHPESFDPEWRYYHGAWGG